MFWYPDSVTAAVIVQMPWQAAERCLVALALAAAMLVIYTSMSQLFTLVYMHVSSPPQVEVIWVEDSPPPSRRPVTPRSPRSPPVHRAGRAVRAGKARVVNHKRCTTKRFDPSLKNHCTFHNKAAARNPPREE